MKSRDADRWADQLHAELGLGPKLTYDEVRAKIEVARAERNAAMEQACQVAVQGIAAAACACARSIARAWRITRRERGAVYTD